MVFSFFKKDQKDTKPGGDRAGSRIAARPVARPEQKSLARPLTAPVNRSLNRITNADTTGSGGFAVTENALPDREMARSLAMATAAKIDAIESEMARDFLRPRKSSSEAPGDTAQPGEAASPAAAAAAPEGTPTLASTSRNRGAQAEEDGFDPGSEILGGSIDAIEVDGSAASVLDETAILFANRQDQAAESGLRAALVAEALGALTDRGWLMMLELLQQRGERAGYDQLAAQFTLRFSVPAPAWINYNDTEKRPAVRTGMPVVSLPESIDAGIVKALEEFKTLATSHPALTLDVSATRRIDLVGAELLLRVFNAFKRASHELTVRGAEQLLSALRSAVEPGRRDPSDAAWMLLLELQRLLDRQADFEETGIQYCITYEVSPPSWEPPYANIRVSGATEAPAGRAVDPLDWKGEILGDGEQYLGRLVVAAKESKRPSIECRQLRRMAFPAATALLGQLIKLQQSGVSVEFRNVNCLVAALWHLLGVSSVADVRVRRT
ncbi:MAG TPA: STAS domain-containing protein [Burkholderiaceae bacterium]|nr:STAS domain-containing protein [Burkholderiaceae bacterium]